MQPPSEEDNFTERGNTLPIPRAWPLDHLGNVGHCLTETARRMPDSIAVAATDGSRKWDWIYQLPRSGDRAAPPNRYREITFSQLEFYSNQLARGIIQMGTPVGTRMALLVPPGIDFVAWVFGLFKAGMVIILIDPGMGRRNIIRCLAEASPAGMVGIRRAHLARNLFSRQLPACRHNVVLGHWPGCRSSAEFRKFDGQNFQPLPIDREQEAAIIFTTGSTGPPKGVLYRHRVFLEQAAQIRDYFDIKPGTVDISGFPLFALFNTAMGTTTVFPRMDATRPASVQPPEIIQVARQYNADQSFGSPALWNRVTQYCLDQQITLPSIRRVLSAGAPVSVDVLDRIKKIIHPGGEAFTPYGATEALPIACLAGSDVLTETAAATAEGAGTCVGHRFPRIRWRVIRIVDHPLPEITACEEVPPGEIGELIVSGPVVTEKYVTRVEANADHKIRDGESFWHRMGDVGYLDQQQRFWYCGRKSHRVVTPFGTMFTDPCEGIFNSHPRIYRSALIGYGKPGREVPVIVAEPVSGQWPKGRSQKQQLLTELRRLAQQYPTTARIEHFFLHRGLPVDIRHNSKIFREKLRPWVARQIRRMVRP
jgi:acyl-CoA synthetase (AMP-forming)/AMP-acid ligase II